MDIQVDVRSSDAISFVEICVWSTMDTHTQASFNTMRYKGRASVSGIGRRLLIICPGATTVVAP
jgi:hypothetical protein